MKQEVKNIAIKDLVLWTENPRDPINKEASDQDIVDRALADNRSKWGLPKLSKEMGSYYDFSELPTVVYHGEKPVVYDGNRRMVLAKIKHGLVTIEKNRKVELPNFPEEIPCNVCDEKTALNNVLRKHSESGSWDPLERDIFLHRFMGKSKSAFLILEEDTGLISANPHLNQRFVKEEIFKEEILDEIGFGVQDGRLISVHDDNEARTLLLDISGKIERKEITTRKNRGKVKEMLDPVSQRLVEKNKSKSFHLSKVNFKSPEKEVENKKQTKRSTKKESELFGGKLYLKMGETGDIYRDIVDLYQFYTSNKNKLSSTFPSLIRMSLRLLCETAAGKLRFEDYLKNNFSAAKKELDQDITTTLSNHNVTEKSIVQLLHTGAHAYRSSSNMEQTIAISIIIGAILTITHGKSE